MAKGALKWDENTKRLYSVGVDRGVLYVMGEGGKYQDGVAWSGLTKVSESPEGAESNKKYADNRVYANIISTETFKGTIEAFYSPKEFDQCDGMAEIAKGVMATQQTRKKFGLCYRTLIGNDTDSTEHGIEIHLVYGATASPSSKDRETINESPEPAALSWSFDTEPVNVTGMKPTAHLVIRSTEIEKEKWTKLEEALYGKGDTGTGTEPKLPLPDEIKTLLQ